PVSIPGSGWRPGVRTRCAPVSIPRPGFDSPSCLIQAALRSAYNRMSDRQVDRPRVRLARASFATTAEDRETDSHAIPARAPDRGHGNADGWASPGDSR